MKRILFITPFAPSNIGAAMKFTKKTIETLALSYIVDLVYFMAEGETEYCPANENIHVLRILKVRIKDRLQSVLGHPFLFPIFSVRYRKSLMSEIKQWNTSHKYDLLFLDHSQSFIYGKAFPEIPKILMSHDVIVQRISRSSGKLMTLFCKNTEKRMINQPNASVFSFSTKDQTIIKEQYGIESYVTCGNIDDQVYQTKPSEIQNRFVFFGQWVRKDNSSGLEWFLKEVYPKTDMRMNFVIIGRGLSKELIALVDKSERVEYMGFVENPYQLIADSKAVLSPLFTGAGVKFKVLESLACGTPVIGSDIAFEGIPTEFSNYMIYANSTESYLKSMQDINYTCEERIIMKENFIRDYVNPYIIKYIANILK